MRNSKKSFHQGYVRFGFIEFDTIEFLYVDVMDINNR